jgi:hypothetical protein
VENVKTFFSEIGHDGNKKNAEFLAYFKNTNLPLQQNAPKKLVTYTDFYFCP